MPAAGHKFFAQAVIIAFELARPDKELPQGVRATSCMHIVRCSAHQIGQFQVVLISSTRLVLSCWPSITFAKPDFHFADNSACDDPAHRWRAENTSDTVQVVRRLTRHGASTRALCRPCKMTATDNLISPVVANGLSIPYHQNQAEELIWQAIGPSGTSFCSFKVK